MREGVKGQRSMSAKVKGQRSMSASVLKHPVYYYMVQAHIALQDHVT